MYYQYTCSCPAGHTLPILEPKQICSQSIGFCYYINGFKKRLEPLTLESLDQRFPNFFERDPNLSFMNTSRLSLFLSPAMLHFFHVSTLQTDTGKQW